MATCMQDCNDTRKHAENRRKKGDRKKSIRDSRRIDKTIALRNCCAKCVYSITKLENVSHSLLYCSFFHCVSMLFISLYIPLLHCDLLVCVKAIRTFVCCVQRKNFSQFGSFRKRFTFFFFSPTIREFVCVNLVFSCIWCNSFGIRFSLVIQ